MRRHQESQYQTGQGHQKNQGCKKIQEYQEIQGCQRIQEYQENQGCQRIQEYQESQERQKYQIHFIRRLYCLLTCILCVVLLSSGCAEGYTEERSSTSIQNPGVKVSFFDVGKGDAILIETQGHTMLIDTGYDKTCEVIEKYLTAQDIQRLDYLVITHFDKDHVGGADRIIKDFEVGEIWQPDYESDAGQYLEYCAAMEEKGVEPILMTESMRLTLDGAEFYVYPPQEKSYKEEDNDFSLVISMTYQEKSFLFAGDCEEVRLDELLSQTEFDLPHDVLKVPHHGKKEENSEEFFRAVEPEIAVITCSGEQPAGKKICAALENLGTEIYLTSDGTVTCMCDGETLQVLQE